MFKKILLFSLMTIIISVIMVSAYEDKFPRIGFKPPYDLNNPNHYYYPFFSQGVDTLHMTAFVHDNLIPFKTEDFSAAETDSLNLINGIEWYAYGQYSMYQADGYNQDDYFQPNVDGERIRFLSTIEDNTGHGRQIDDLEADSIIHVWYVSKDNPNDTAGYVLDSLWNETLTWGASAIDYSREQDRYDRKYNVIFRLKVPSGYLPDDTVANLEVHFYRGGTADTILAESLLFYSHFQPGQYQSFKDTFWLPPYIPGDYIDYMVKWYKQTDLYIDYVEVYDNYYDSLFIARSPYDSNMTAYQWEIINGPFTKPLDDQFGGRSLYRWYLQDEPNYDQFRSSRRVSYLLDSLNYTPGIQAVSGLNPYRYLNELDSFPHEVFYDDYPVLKLRENDNDELQRALDGFAARLWDVNDAARSKNKEWWYIAQTYYERNDSTTRYPHNNELKATVFMALAYGAKGIGYYKYAASTNGDHANQGALVDSSQGGWIHVQTYPYPDNQYYAGTHEYLFDAVKDINQKLDTLGPILKKLEWKWAGPGDSARYAPGSFLDSIEGRNCEECCSNCICKYPTLPNHIQVGMFKDTSSLGDDYFMLVNRWVGYTERPCEKVTLARGRYSYRYDCLTGEFMDTLPPNGSFHVVLWPGEGRLYRLANFLKPNLSGSVITTNPQKIRLSWTDPNRNETSYRVERKLSSQQWPPSGAEIGSTNANVTSYYDTNLVGSETYNYRVRASDEQYYSEYSNEITVKNIPNPPRNLTAHLNRICCPGRGSGAGSGVGIDAICPYCYTNKIILSWQEPQNQKSGTLTQYKITATGPGLPGGSQSHTVPDEYTSTTFCVPELGQSYSFTVRAIDTSGNQSNPSNTVNITSGTTDNCGGGEPQTKIVAQVIPEKFELFQNYPNPFNFGTLIKYALPEESEVKIVVYNLLGQKVRVLVEDVQEPGYYTISWNGKNDNSETVGSGIYFYRIQAGSFSKTAKMSLLK